MGSPRTPATKLLVGIGVVALWFAGEAVYEGWRMAGGGGQPSWLHRLLTENAVALTAQPCVRSLGGEGSVWTAPLGHCNQWSEVYLKAPAQSIVVRHSMNGSRIAPRMALNVLHVVGAIGCFVMIAALGLTGGAVGDSPVNRLARRTLLSTIYTMLCTGMVLFVMQDPLDNGFFPRPEVGDSLWLRYGFIAAFGLSFVNAVCHANLFQPVPAGLLVIQHAISFVGSSIALGFFAYRLLTIPTSEYLWSYSLELVVLTSVYPMLDLLNGWVLYRTQVRGRPYDWDAHRNDNLTVFAVLITVVVFFFFGSGTHFVIKTQLALLWRLALDMIPVLWWVASGRLPAYVSRVMKA